jgi:hypothetical protein
MSFFTPQTKVVEIDEHNRVTVRKLSTAKRNEALLVGMVEQDEAIRGLLWTDAFLRRAIVSWDGPGFEGREVNQENIDQLPPEVTDKLLPAVMELNRQTSVDEGNASAAPTNTI